MNKIQLTKINKCFKNRFCLSNLSFIVEAGEIFGFLGTNGAGKTTTIRILLGLMKPDSGSASLLNDETPLSRSKIGIVLEDEKPFDGLTPYEYLDFFATYYSVDSKEKRARIEDILKRFYLYDWRDIKIKNFSKGMKRKLTVSKALLHKPSIIIMDEPFQGIEPESRRDIKETLKHFAGMGKIVFLSTHNLDEAENFCSSFGIIQQGKFMGKWNMKELNCSLEDFYLKRTNKI